MVLLQKWNASPPLRRVMSNSSNNTISKTTTQRIGEPIPDEDLPSWVLAAKRAMQRGTRKEFERKRKLGEKIVVFRDGKVVVVDPPEAAGGAQ